MTEKEKAGHDLSDSRPRHKEQEKIRDIKRALCVAMKTAMYRTRLNQEEIAWFYSLTAARLSNISKHKYDEISFDLLIRYLVRLDPHFDFILSLSSATSTSSFNKQPDYRERRAGIKNDIGE